VPRRPLTINRQRSEQQKEEEGNLGVVVLPDAAGDLVAPEVEGLELDPADAQLF